VPATSTIWLISPVPCAMSEQSVCSAAGTPGTNESDPQTPRGFRRGPQTTRPSLCDGQRPPAIDPTHPESIGVPTGHLVACPSLGPVEHAARIESTGATVRHHTDPDIEIPSESPSREDSPHPHVRKPSVRVR